MQGLTFSAYLDWGLNLASESQFSLTKNQRSSINYPFLAQLSRSRQVSMQFMNPLDIINAIT
jgi:hypothetical protein